MMKTNDAVVFGAGHAPHYAVIFRTHFWDAFAQRQFDRIRQNVKSGDIFVLVDETHGKVSGITHDRVVRHTEQDLVDLGLPRAGGDNKLWAGASNMLWFNGDYPLYLFLRQQPGYDYYLQMEYDVVINTDVDSLVLKAGTDGADFVGLTKGEPVDEWMWLHTCTDLYRMSEIRYKLICLSLFSNRGLTTLFEARLAMADKLRAGLIQAWPFCEGFIATEMARNGFVSVEWSRYSATDHYDTWPPFVEADLFVMPSGSIVHPVLDRNRYVASLMKVKVGLFGYLNPNSLLHRKLRRLPPSAYLKALMGTFTQKVTRVLRSTSLGAHLRSRRV